MGARWLALASCVAAMALPAGTGTPIELKIEDLRGPSVRPLAATRDRLHERFKRAFIWLYKAQIADGTAVVGRWAADRGPLRLTMILLHGYSSDWSLSALRFRMVEKGAAGGKDVEFAKDADWLVGNLIDPQWVVSIRIE